METNSTDVLKDKIFSEIATKGKVALNDLYELANLYPFNTPRPSGIAKSAAANAIADLEAKKVIEIVDGECSLKDLDFVKDLIISQFTKENGYSCRISKIGNLARDYSGRVSPIIFDVVFGVLKSKGTIKQDTAYPSILYYKK